MSKLVKKLLRENLQQTEKLYFKTGILSPEIKEKILAITHGDVFTRLVADLLVWVKRFSEIKENEIKLASVFYNYLKHYNKSSFSLAKDLFYYSDENNDPYHISDLFELLRERHYAEKNFRELPSLAQRNLGYLKRGPYTYKYDLSNIAQKEYKLKELLDFIPKTEKGQILLKKIYSQKNLDGMIELAEHYNKAFSGEEGEDKDELLDALETLNAKVIQNTNDILVIRVNDYEAMKRIGCTSTWCFSRPNAEQYWDDYAVYGFVYVIFDFSKDFDDATFLMTLLPDSDSVYGSSNFELSELGIDNSTDYLKKIGVNIDNIYADEKKYKYGKETNTQLSLFEIKKTLREQLENTNPFKQYEQELLTKGFEAEFNPVNDNLVTIEIIGIPKKLHGQGYGTKIMKDLCNLADQKNITLQLRPAASSTHSRTKLIRFYSKFGFVENKGENENPNYQYMYRKPQGLNEQVINEAALSFNNLPEGTGLYVNHKQNYLKATLYNPSEDKVYAMIVLNLEDGLYELARVAAEKGFGPLIYEIAMTLVYPQSIVPPRWGDIKPEALNVFKKFGPNVKREKISLDDQSYSTQILTRTTQITDPEEKEKYYNSQSLENKEILDVFNTKYSYKMPNIGDMKKYIKFAKQTIGQEFNNIKLTMQDVNWKSTLYFNERY
jgi:Acetyltransferase (GNAT) domain